MRLLWAATIAYWLVGAAPAAFVAGNLRQNAEVVSAMNVAAGIGLIAVIPWMLAGALLGIMLWQRGKRRLSMVHSTLLWGLLLIGNVNSLSA